MIYIHAGFSKPLSKKQHIPKFDVSSSFSPVEWLFDGGIYPIFMLDFPASFCKRGRNSSLLAERPVRPGLSGGTALEIQPARMFGTLWPGAQLSVGDEEGKPGIESLGFLQQSHFDGEEVPEGSRRGA
jgi:hypothetical protein